MIKISNNLIQFLTEHPDAAIRYKTYAQLFDEDTSSPKLKGLQEQIQKSPRVQTLLSERDTQGKIPFSPYKKWNGTHWVLTALAELDYPPGDERLLPMRDQVYEWLFSSEHKKKIVTIEGKTRRCASQEANALFSSLTLGLTDERTPLFVKNLLLWQWPDGGWNCDKNPKAHNSSFMETITPLRALNRYAQMTDDAEARSAVKRATEIFLKRHLYKRQSTNETIRPDFVKLHYPLYWHYDILFGLKNIAEAGLIHDARCNDALDLLESKQLTNGGFPAEGRYYRQIHPTASQYSLVDWGGVSKKRVNPWVTIDALYVLKQSGRLKI